jgi:hypothetical protein
MALGGPEAWQRVLGVKRFHEAAKRGFEIYGDHGFPRFAEE